MSYQPSSLDNCSDASESGGHLRRQQSLQIPGYEVQHKIGSGGMATVYLASQQSLGRDVAIKVLRCESNDDDQFVQRFKKEGRILAQLQHINIVTIYDVGISEDKKLFLSIEYLNGGTLADRIKLGLPFDAALQIARAIANALGYAHERGIVHRDIKPSNIMFRHDGTPVLTDFGVARVVESKTVHTMEGLTVGSPGYMSPEQVMGESATIQSDLYSLGVVIYEMLVGRPLYQAENPISVAMKHLNAPIPELPNQYAHLQPVLKKLLAKISANRYRSTREFLDALDAIVPSDTGTHPQAIRDFENISLLKFTTGKFRSLLANRKSRLSLTITIISIIILLTAIYYVLSRRLVDHPEIRPAVKSIDSLQPSRRNQQQIATLLKLADAQQKIGLLARDSKEDNAEATYRQVLALDPENAQALTGLDAVASEYARRAQKQLSANDLSESWKLIELGLAANPRHQDLLRLRQEVEGRIAAIRLQKVREEEQQGFQLQAEQFLAQAQSSFREGLLEVSLVHIEQGLLTVPDHPELLALRERVKARIAEKVRQQAAAEQQRREAEARWQAEEAERRKAEKIRLQAVAEQRRQEVRQYLAQAVEAQRKEEHAASAALIEKGLAVVPNHTELLRLRQEVERGIAETKTRQEREAAQRLQAEQFLAQAQNHFTEGTLEISLAHVEQGLLVVPDHPELLALREQVKTRIAEQARQQAEAVKRQQEEAAHQQTTETERQMAEQARQQAELAQRQKETDQYLTRAVELQHKGEQTASLQQIEKGLALVPDHEGLTRLRHKVSTEIAAQQRQQAKQEQHEREITNLLEQAEVHMKAWRLTTPVGNNAEETYQQVLKLDVGNAEALAGLKRIAEAYLQMAQKRRSAGMLPDSLAFIEKGLEVIPNHADLLRLREEVRAKGSEAQQRLEQQQLDRQKEKTKRQDRAATVQPSTQVIPQAKRKPVTAEANATKNRRCDSILSRLTLGEPVSNEDHIFMTKECR